MAIALPDGLNYGPLSDREALARTSYERDWRRHIGAM